MKPRKKLVFKIKDEIILEETTDLTLNQIDEIKWTIARECECSFDDVEAEPIDILYDTSEDVDVSEDGLVYWRSLNLKPLQALECTLEEGSDEYLDAINDGTISDYIVFTL